MGRWQNIVVGLLVASASCTGTGVQEETLGVPKVGANVIARWDAANEGNRPIPSGPNVVMVMLCSWRADQMGTWGGPATTTPALDAMAKSGTRFATTIAQAPWTKPASTAILTGHYPADLGMTEPKPGPNRRVLPATAHTLGEQLHEAGWATIGVVANPNLNSTWGFDQGFDAYVELSGTNREDGDWRAAPGEAVVARALEQLDQKPTSGRPVYLQVMFTDAHAPYGGEGSAASAADVPPQVVAYRRAMSRGDRAFSSLVEGLEKRGIGPENTLFVVVADHGEGLGWPRSHGPHHGFMLHESTVHIPWFFAGKGVSAGDITGLSAQVDMVPTVRGLLGLPALEDTRLSGRDHSGLIRNGGGQTDTAVVFSDTSFRWADRSAAYSATMQCQTDHAPSATRRRVLTGGATPFDAACCRWTEDPACDTPEWDEDLMAKLRAHATERQRRAAANEPQTAVPSPDLNQQLRALGYVGQ